MESAIRSDRGIGGELINKLISILFVTKETNEKKG
jgi:hypothetical protein